MQPVPEDRCRYREHCKRVFECPNGHTLEHCYPERAALAPSQVWEARHISKANRPTGLCQYAGDCEHGLFCRSLHTPAEWKRAVATWDNFHWMCRRLPEVLKREVWAYLAPRALSSSSSLTNKKEDDPAVVLRGRGIVIRNTGWPCRGMTCQASSRKFDYSHGVDTVECRFVLHGTTRLVKKANLCAKCIAALRTCKTRRALERATTFDEIEAVCKFRLQSYYSYEGNKMYVLPEDL